MIVSVYASLAHALTGYAIGLSFAWPNVTIPDFGEQLSSVRTQINADSISFCPLVTEARRLDWQAYAEANQGWMKTSLELEHSNETLPSIRATIEPVSSNPDTVYAPIWQVSPVTTEYGSINRDSLKMIGSPYESLVANPEPTFSKFFYNGPSEATGAQGYLSNEDNWPRGFLSGPVFAKPLAAGEDISSLSLVGIVNAEIPWHTFLRNLLPEETAPGLDLVLRQSCGDIDTIAYRLDGGKVNFTGITYKADPAFVQLRQTTTLVPFPSLNGCEITLETYASSEFKDFFQSNEPDIYLGGIIGIFFVAAIAFLIYDYAVEARQKIVMAKVARSNAIVNSLFPTQVRDRLMAGENKDDDRLSGTTLAKKATDRAFRPSPVDESRRASINLGNSKPIADLYPHSTVMFAGKLVVRILMQ